MRHRGSVVAAIGLTLGSGAAVCMDLLAPAAADAQPADELAAPSEPGEERGAAPTDASSEDVVLPEAPGAHRLVLREPEALAVPAARLDALLATRAADEDGGRAVSSALSLGAGALLAGGGAWLLLDERFRGSGLMPMIGGVSLAFGLAELVLGIYGFASQGVASDRYRRWRVALEGGLDERELGRFEGELRSEAETGRILREVGVVTGIGMALGGAATMLLTGLAPLDELGRIEGYSIGGAFALVGVIELLTSLFSESQAETDWRLYQQGEGPGTRDDFRIDVAPMVSGESLGISLGGTF